MGGRSCLPPPLEASLLCNQGASPLGGGASAAAAGLAPPPAQPLCGPRLPDKKLLCAPHRQGPRSLAGGYETSRGLAPSLLRGDPPPHRPGGVILGRIRYISAPLTLPFSPCPSRSGSLPLTEGALEGPSDHPPSCPLPANLRGGDKSEQGTVEGQTQNRWWGIGLHVLPHKRSGQRRDREGRTGGRKSDERRERDSSLAMSKRKPEPHSRSCTASCDPQIALEEHRWLQYQRGFWTTPAKAYTAARDSFEAPQQQRRNVEEACPSPTRRR